MRELRPVIKALRLRQSMIRMFHPSSQPDFVQ
jgi:hypothetical protein